MDLSRYDIIVKEVGILRNLSHEDKEDLIQDIYVKLLNSKATHITRVYVQRLVRRMLLDRKRKQDRRPYVIFNSEIADYEAGEKL